MMRRITGLLPLLLFLPGSVRGQLPGKSEPTVSGCAADLSTLIEDLQDNYAYRDTSGQPWLQWKLRFGPASETAQTKETCATTLAQALGELHDFHAEVRSRITNRWLPVPTFSDIWAEYVADRPTIVAIRKDSDADRAGLQVGEEILTVGEEPVEAAITERLGPGSSERDAKARSWALLSILTGKADEPRQFGVRSPKGELHTANLPIERHIERPGGELSVVTLPSGIGLIRLNNSLGEQSTVAAFDRALEQVKSTRGLILDLRDTPSGGDSSVALGMMGRFVSAMLPYQRHRIPHYGQPDVERNWLELVAPRGPFTYGAPVALLVDHWTGSMGEGIAIGFDGLRRAIVIGTPMAHLAGAVTTFQLPATGIQVAFATEQLFHANGKPREDWLPPVLVGQNSAGKGDLILHRAEKELQATPRLTGRSR